MTCPPKGFLVWIFDHSYVNGHRLLIYIYYCILHYRCISLTPTSSNSYWIPVVASKFSHPDGEESDDERDDVGEHVEGVGDESHGVSDVADDDLDEEVSRC